MLARDRDDKFAITTIVLHWLVAVGVIALLAVGLVMNDMPEGAEKSRLVGLHANGGAALFLLGMVRLAWRRRNGLPAPGAKHRRWERNAARTVHIVLLAAPIYMPLAGLMLALGKGYDATLFGLVALPGESTKGPMLAAIGQRLHGTGGLIVMIALLAHIAAALKHEGLDRDGTLRRMFGARIARN